MASRAITLWLASRASTFSSREDASVSDKMMAVCVGSYTNMLKVMDSSERIMTEGQAAEFHKLTLRHLRSYTWLHKEGMKEHARNIAGKKCFQLLPKQHHLWHVAFDVLRTRINPRASQLLSAESFIGVMGRIGRACHRTTISTRALERYLLKLEVIVRWSWEPERCKKVSSIHGTIRARYDWSSGLVG